ncbi:hypothetical protein KKC44_01600 [Patescibacteria group bacterium]|nr:hypothetical protein [Patescibacteria group bacterium]
MEEDIGQSSVNVTVALRDNPNTTFSDYGYEEAMASMQQKHEELLSDLDALLDEYESKIESDIPKPKEEVSTEEPVSESEPKPEPATKPKSKPAVVPAAELSDELTAPPKPAPSPAPKTSSATAPSPRPPKASTAPVAPAASEPPKARPAAPEDASDNPIILDNQTKKVLDKIIINAKRPEDQRGDRLVLVYDFLYLEHEMYRSPLEEEDNKTKYKIARYAANENIVMTWNPMYFQTVEDYIKRLKSYAPKGTEKQWSSLENAIQSFVDELAGNQSPSRDTAARCVEILNSILDEHSNADKLKPRWLTGMFGCLEWGNAPYRIQVVKNKLKVVDQEKSSDESEDSKPEATTPTAAKKPAKPEAAIPAANDKPIEPTPAAPAAAGISVEPAPEPASDTLEPEDNNLDSNGVPIPEGYNPNEPVLQPASSQESTEEPKVDSIIQSPPKPEESNEVPQEESIEATDARVASHEKREEMMQHAADLVESINVELNKTEQPYRMKIFEDAGSDYITLIIRNPDDPFSVHEERVLLKQSHDKKSFIIQQAPQVCEAKEGQVATPEMIADIVQTWHNAQEEQTA